MESTNQEENRAGVTSLEDQSPPRPVNRSSESPVDPEQGQITQLMDSERSSAAVPPKSTSPATESNEEKTDLQTNIPRRALIVKESMLTDGNNMQERVDCICASFPDLKYVLIHDHKPGVITWTGNGFRASNYPVKMVLAPKDHWSRAQQDHTEYHLKRCFSMNGRGNIKIEFVAFEEIVSAVGSTKD
ncbi:hypothetical protein BDZ45DRAFT_783519 [Acephala macrosclerotiorum]|nr:hypothetical protein BDZ45DRAFT_783519 [Acephala macrosclerotiorum]